MKLDTIKINKKLKRLRKNQQWLSEKTGVSRQLISYWLTNRSLAGAERLAKALGVKPKSLIK